MLSQLSVKSGVCVLCGQFKTMSGSRFIDTHKIRRRSFDRKRRRSFDRKQDPTTGTRIKLLNNPQRRPVMARSRQTLTTDALWAIPGHSLKPSLASTAPCPTWVGQRRLLRLKACTHASFGGNPYIIESVERAFSIYNVFCRLCPCS